MEKKILFIIPALQEVRVTKEKIIKHKKMFTLPYLGILYLAALTPKEYKVKIINEHIDILDFEEKADIVAITVMTPLANRAYEISEEFRKRGVKTILGGLHPTYMPYEALKHCDVVVKGEAEEIWQKILKDYERNKLKKIYKQKKLTDLSKLPLPRRELLIDEKSPYDIIHATRGCVHRCEFCSVHNFFNNQFRKRPIESIIEEIKTLKGKMLFFIDDNLTANKEWAKDLFRAMIPLKKKWISMAAITIALDDELLILARRSGCLGFFIGLETMDIVNLDSSKKYQNRAIDYKWAINNIQKHGLGVSAGTVYGFDNDKKEVFKKTLDFAIANNLCMLQVSPLVPFPGTNLYKRFKKEKREMEKDWSKYNFYDVPFTPKNFSKEELLEGMSYVRKKYYSYPSIIKRVLRNSINLGLYSTIFNFFLNWSYRNNQKKGFHYPP